MTKRKIPKTLHCHHCKFVTHSGIGAMGKHVRKEHPNLMKKRKLSKEARVKSGYCKTCGKKL